MSTWNSGYHPTPIWPTNVCGENTVQSPGIVIFGGTNQPPSGRVGFPYRAGYTPSPGVTGSFTFSAGLPPGVTETSDGVLSGTPTTAGTYTFTATLTNAAGSNVISSTIVIAP